MSLIEGCEIHNVTREQVLERWNHPMVAAANDVTLCACCDAPARSEMCAVADELGNDLPGGVSRMVRCTRCQVVTVEQEQAIIDRLFAGYPKAASGHELRARVG